MEVDAGAIGHEQLLFGGLVLPSHLARLLHEYGALLGDLASKHAALVLMCEVRGKIANRIVLALKRRRNFRRGRVRLRREGHGYGKNRNQYGPAGLHGAMCDVFRLRGRQVQCYHPPRRRLAPTNASTSATGWVLSTMAGSIQPRRARPTPSLIWRSSAPARWQSLSMTSVTPADAAARARGPSRSRWPGAPSISSAVPVSAAAAYTASKSSG